MPFEPDTSAWSGEGTFTQLLIDRLSGIAGVRLVRVEDAVRPTDVEPGQ